RRRTRRGARPGGRTRYLQIFTCRTRGLRLRLHNDRGREEDVPPADRTYLSMGRCPCVLCVPPPPAALPRPAPHPPATGPPARPEGRARQLFIPWFFFLEDHP